MITIYIAKTKATSFHILENKSSQLEIFNMYHLQYCWIKQNNTGRKQKKIFISAVESLGYNALDLPLCKIPQGS
jgi:hypothetical protein